MSATSTVGGTAVPDRILRPAPTLLVVLAVTLMLVVGVLVWLDALVLHVLYARLCGVLDWTAPRTGERLTGGSGEMRPG